jgi:hypothetical protein
MGRLQTLSSIQVADLTGAAVSVSEMATGSLAIRAIWAAAIFQAIADVADLTDA